VEFLPRIPPSGGFGEQIVPTGPLMAKRDTESHTLLLLNNKPVPLIPGAGYKIRQCTGVIRTGPSRHGLVMFPRCGNGADRIRIRRMALSIVRSTLLRLSNNWVSEHRIPNSGRYGSQSSFQALEKLKPNPEHEFATFRYQNW
jgi:hypothetical protein